jgi:hypothetical protein
MLHMPPDAALAALAHAMAARHPRLAVVDADWPKYLERFPAGGVPPLLRALAATPASPAAAARAQPQSRERRRPPCAKRWPRRFRCSATTCCAARSAPRPRA